MIVISVTKLKIHMCVCVCVCPQVREVVQPPKPTPTCAVARPVRRAPPTSIQDMRRFPEIIPVQEVIPEETAEEESSAPVSEEKGWMPE